MRHPKVGNLVSVVILVLLEILIAGCTMVPIEPMSKQESLAVQEKSSTIVMYRITGTDDGKPIATWETGWTRTYVNLRPLEVSYSPPEYWLWVPTRALSDESQKNGWQYIVLKPGSYRLFLNTPYDGDKWTGDHEDNRPASFWLNVSGNESIIYAGSLHMECMTTSGAKSCNNKILINVEEGVARYLASTYFPDFGIPTTIPMTPYGRVLIADELKMHDSLQVSLTGQSALHSPNWEERAFERYIGKPMSWVDSGEGMLLFLVYWPFGSTMGALEAKKGEKYASCMKNLNDKLQDIDLPLLLQHAITENAQTLGIKVIFNETDLVTGDQLQIGLQRLQFRQCKLKGEYCLELVVRFRLFDSSQEILKYDAFQAYSNKNAWYAESDLWQLLQHFVLKESPCFNLKRYCESEGMKTFENDLLRGVSAIADELLVPSNHR